MSYSQYSPTPTHYSSGPGSSRQFDSPSSATSLSQATRGSPNHHHFSAEMAFVQIDPYREDMAQQKSMQLLNGLVSQETSSTLAKAPPKLAETTRKFEDKRDDPNDPETIAGMKCQLDVDREIWARKRALFLLENGNLS